MSYGLRIYNSIDARPLIDAERLTFVYGGSYAMTATPTGDKCDHGTPGWVPLVADMTHSVAIPKSVAPNMPLCFVELPTYPAGAALGLAQETETSWQIHAIATLGYTPVLHVFHRISGAAASSGFGLQVFDASGQRVFDSIEAKPLNLLKAPFALQSNYFSSYMGGPGNLEGPLLGSYNDTAFDTGIELPANVLIRGQGFLMPTRWEENKAEGNKQIHAKVFGRTGNTLIAFGILLLTCPYEVQYPFCAGIPEHFSGGPWTPTILLADRSVYA